MRQRRSVEAEARIAHGQRLAACLAGGFVLALMIGNQEGTQQDFGYAFRQAVLGPRILLFLGIGVALYLAITFGPRLTPYLKRPGFRPLVAGALTVVVSLTLLHWTDSPAIDSGKFRPLAAAAADTGGLSPLARVFFGSGFTLTPYLVLILITLVAAVGVLGRRPPIAYAAAGLAVVAGVWAMYSQSAVRSFIGFPDHSTGAGVALLGFLTIAVAAFVSARSERQEADRQAFVDTVMGWRPGLPLVVIALVLGLVGLFSAAWFSPADRNAGLAGTATLFSGEPVSALTTAYLGWLAYVLLFGTLAVAAAASYLRRRVLGYVAIGLGLVSTLLTLYVVHDFGSVAGSAKFDSIPGAWDNLGTGSWIVCAAFSLLAGAGYLVVSALTPPKVEPFLGAADSDQVGAEARGGGLPQPSQFGAAVMLLVVTAALFYPPTATDFWQTVLVSEIGIYVLLAIGLNVVVGWAGLLDLGFIAFYAIGSYTTAYLTDRLPVHPPHWLVLSPLAAIPFAILICLIAGVTLGAPTLRLRGDYLAIVTLGFGEIIRVVANNANSITSGPRGAFNIPPPEIHLGPLDIQWGQSALGFWYLLLALVVIVVVLFNRLEHSRIGRAWAAVREDEVAAQATGINTTRVKLLAFAIGASTSGVAGVFFASQVGSFTPENFVLANSILVVAYVVFGGMGSLPGAMAGAAVLTWLPEFLKDQVPAEDRQMWIGAIIILMMIFRPAGLIPARRRKAELGGLDRSLRTEPSAVPASEGL